MKQLLTDLIGVFPHNPFIRPELKSLSSAKGVRDQCREFCAVDPSELQNLLKHDAASLRHVPSLMRIHIDSLYTEFDTEEQTHFWDTVDAIVRLVMVMNIDGVALLDPFAKQVMRMSNTDKTAFLEQLQGDFSNPLAALSKLTRQFPSIQQFVENMSEENNMLEVASRVMTT